MPRTPEEIIRLLHEWVNGDSSYFGTVPCQIEHDDGPISTILIEAGELEVLTLVRRLAPQRREERERRLLTEAEGRRLIFRNLLRRNRTSESTLPLLSDGYNLTREQLSLMASPPGTATHRLRGGEGQLPALADPQVISAGAN
jgi:hypothetical protein